MENKNLNNEKKEKKLKVDFTSKDDLKKNILDFYNTKIKKVHIILFIIMTIAYCIIFFTTINQIKSEGYAESSAMVVPTFLNSIKNNVFLDFVVILAGITPYCFLSILGLIQVPALINELGIRYALQTSFVPTLFIGGLIQLIGLALVIAIGIYYCVLSTKKKKYYNFSSFGFKDLKMHFYEMRNDEKKLEEYKNKTMEKAKEAEKNNIKIPYLNFVCLGMVALVIQIIGVLITKI